MSGNTIRVVTEIEPGISVLSPPIEVGEISIEFTDDQELLT